MTKLYFIRHPKIGLNVGTKFVGQRTDAEASLNEPELNALWSKLRDKIISSIFTSPLRRCLDTARRIQEKSGIPQITIDNNLKEIDYGEADGKDLEFLKKNYPRIIREWSEGKDPRFPGGENYADVLQRVNSFLANFKKGLKQNCVVFTHNVFLRVLLGSQLNIPRNRWYKIRIEHLDPYEVIVTRDGKVFVNLSKEQSDNLFSSLCVQTK
ncbi:histidine phosphatase family protein [Candidatus Micrarchaeota archaeon]|nr:histidine phosphatase family protein [Candidatus Micrarchaeota archaeon]